MDHKTRLEIANQLIIAGDRLISMRSFEAAVWVYSSALKFWETPSTFLKLSRAQEATGATEEALRSLEIAHKSGALDISGQRQALMLSAILRFRAKDYEASFESSKQLVCKYGDEFALKFMRDKILHQGFEKAGKLLFEFAFKKYSSQFSRYKSSSDLLDECKSWRIDSNGYFFGGCFEDFFRTVWEIHLKNGHESRIFQDIFREIFLAINKRGPANFLLGNLVQTLGPHHFRRITQNSIIIEDGSKFSAKHSAVAINSKISIHKPSRSIYEIPVALQEKLFSPRTHHLVVIPEGEALIQRDGFAVFTDRGQFIEGVCMVNGPMLSAFSDRESTDTLRLSGTIFLLTQCWSTEYSHWMTESIPRLFLLSAAGIDLNSIDYFVVPRLTDFVRQTFELLGIEQSRLLEAGGFKRLTAKELIVTSAIESYNFSPLLTDGVDYGIENDSVVAASLRWLASHVSTGTSPCVRKVYLKRPKSGLRTFLNDDDIDSVIDSYGFEIIYTSQFSMAEKVRLMKEVQFAVGMAGANTTHISFMNPGTSALIFLPRTRPARDFLTIANHLNINHFHLLCDSPENFFPKKVEVWRNDLIMNLSDLRRSMDLLLSNK